MFEKDEQRELQAFVKLKRAEADIASGEAAQWDQDALDHHAKELGDCFFLLNIYHWSSEDKRRVISAFESLSQIAAQKEWFETAFYAVNYIPTHSMFEHWPEKSGTLSRLLIQKAEYLLKTGDTGFFGMLADDIEEMRDHQVMLDSRLAPIFVQMAEVWKECEEDGADDIDLYPRGREECYMHCQSSWENGSIGQLSLYYHAAHCGGQGDAAQTARLRMRELNILNPFLNAMRHTWLAEVEIDPERKRTALLEAWKILEPITGKWTIRETFLLEDLFKQALAIDPEQHARMAHHLVQYGEKYIKEHKFMRGLGMILWGINFIASQSEAFFEEWLDKNAERIGPKISIVTVYGWKYLYNESLINLADGNDYAAQTFRGAVHHMAPKTWQIAEHPDAPLNKRYVMANLNALFLYARDVEENREQGEAWKDGIDLQGAASQVSAMVEKLVQIGGRITLEKLHFMTVRESGRMKRYQYQQPEPVQQIIDRIIALHERAR